MRATNEHSNKNSTGTSVTLALAGAILKEDISDFTTVASTFFAGGALIRGVQGIEKQLAVATIFFNSSNTYVMTNEVTSWLKSTSNGKQFLAVYTLSNTIVNLGSLYNSNSSLDIMVGSLSTYLDLGGEFGETFQGKFPQEYLRLITEMQKLR